MEKEKHGLNEEIISKYFALTFINKLAPVGEIRKKPHTNNTGEIYREPAGYVDSLVIVTLLHPVRNA